MDSIELVLRSDQGVRDMAALYAALNDWYENIRPERKGVRACERVTRIRDDGLVPIAQRYFEHIADTHGREFDGDAESLLSDWAADFRPDYVARADDLQWEEYGRGITRCNLDGENHGSSSSHSSPQFGHSYLITSHSYCLEWPTPTSSPGVSHFRQTSGSSAIVRGVKCSR